VAFGVRCRLNSNKLSIYQTLNKMAETLNTNENGNCDNCVVVVTFNSLLELLAMYGGKIISSNDLHADLIDQARAAKRMYVDENFLGYIWEPPFAGRFPVTEEEVKMFEWCYPLEVELPEQLKNTDWINRIIEGGK
jgi:hypothetical protein